MGIDITLYRSRIGLFQTRPVRNVPLKDNVTNLKYNPYTRSSDVHFRMLVCMILFGSIAILGELTLMLSIKYHYTFFIYNTSSSWNEPFVNIYTNSIHRSITLLYNYSVSMQRSQYGSFFQRLLLLSADVELNPGPLTDKDEILREIRSSKDDLMGELKTVKHDVRTLTEDMDILKTSQTKLKSDVSDVQIIQCKLETRIADLETSVDRLKHDKDALKQENELLQLDIDDLSDQVTAKTKLIDALKT